MRWCLRFLGMVGLLFLCGCALLDSSQTDLQSSADDFCQRLRWADYQGAQRHVAARRQETFQTAVVAPGQDLKMVEVHFEKEGPAGREGRRPMTLVMEYYRLPSTEIRTARIDLEWIYLDYGWTRPGIWLIDSDFRPLP
ncbi:MAG: hypothetical protein P1P74_04350 [Desulfuromonadales bacterium]|nr:hypothetical protein [Desulfuromonadales bacterium]MDT8423542.1 hypothetical protein [Desulfuromonadales bacterium]